MVASVHRMMAGSSRAGGSEKTVAVQSGMKNKV